ncbi:ABC transporter ATP-binding protein [[Clostridium] polysaccharolyticum]|uniref:ABC-2 type transport system ATP-binding protein n=1 Tax=[Clostridium] polysaccharolyticum TaxID=29364 RepID=A0A1I0DQB5_9FIRM|nr:ABC transporter ATP-binding protein [[Clostridium] polysaccharolyticum]SET34745.1 ABC-2 type transport system ATP-binding protein [[Clostridium] polysaccharolyticum]
MNVLEIRNLNKKFGEQTVIQNLNVTIPENSVFGFLGQNGAGKTTTMKMILGLLKADSGEIRVCGEKVEYGQNMTNRYIGYLPDVPEYYGYMSSLEYLKFCGKITGMKRDEIKRKSDELIEMVGLGESRKKRIGSFSRGMKQRLGIAQGLLNSPKLLICDEPTSALDPIGRNEILNLLSYGSCKTTILFSTHILSDVEKICRDIAILHNGRVVLSGPIDKIKSEHNTNLVEVRFSSVDDIEQFLNLKDVQKYRCEVDREKRHVILHGSNQEEIVQKLIEILYQSGIVPSGVNCLEPSLDSLFSEVVR